MDERAALGLLAEELESAGDDAAVVDGTVLTTDMLHERTDFPSGTTRYTAGWRSVGASLSDVAATGAAATAAVAVYAAPEFDRDELLAFVRGARDVCRRVGAEYVGGDLDDHDEFTVATTAVGETDDPVRRSGARPGDVLCVTGTFGRTAAALDLFERAAGREDRTGGREDHSGSPDDGPGSADGHPDRGADSERRQADRERAKADRERANDLFRFEPRVAAGRAVAPHATAMMDSSDGLARSVHQLGEASGCGVALESDRIPVADALADVAEEPEAALEAAITFGEDFELVFAVPEETLDAVREASPVSVATVGRVVEDGLTLDGEPLADRGYTHG